MHSIYALSQSTSASPPSLIFHKLKQHVCMHFFEKRSILGLRILSFKLFTTNFTIIYAKTCTIHSFYPSRPSACCSTETGSKHKLMYNRPQFCSRKEEPDIGVDPDGFSPIKKVNEMCDSPYKRVRHCETIFRVWFTRPPFLSSPWKLAHQCLLH